MGKADECPYVGRGGLKLEFALDHFSVDVGGLMAADLGSHIGGFVDCLLQRGAAKVYSVDTSYGTLAWTMRQDDRVVVMERTNALHVQLPEKVDVVTIDVGWTPQRLILPHALTLLKSSGVAVSLLKPQYEAQKDELTKGVVREELVEQVVERTIADLRERGIDVAGEVWSPYLGGGGNREALLLIHTGSATNC